MLVAIFALETPDLISHVHLASFVNVLPKQLQHSTLSRCFRSVIVCTTDGCLDTPITLFFFTCTISIPPHLPVSSSQSASPCSALSSLASSTGSSAEQKPILCERNLLHTTTFDYLTIHFNIIIIFNVEIIFFRWDALCVCTNISGDAAASLFRVRKHFYRQMTNFTSSLVTNRDVIITAVRRSAQYR